jgi:hypothetical protein
MKKEGDRCVCQCQCQRVPRAVVAEIGSEISAPIYAELRTVQ